MIPCLLFKEFISPLRCLSDNRDLIILSKFETIKDGVNSHYNIKVKNISPIIESSNYNMICDNSIFKNGKWIRKNGYDFTCYLSLMNHNHSVPFNDEYDCYGGELIFPSFKIQLSFNMGDLLIFPSLPNFVHYHNKPMIGNFKYLKFYLTCEESFIFDYRKVGKEFALSI